MKLLLICMLLVCCSCSIQPRRQEKTNERLLRCTMQLIERDVEPLKASEICLKFFKLNR